MKTRLTLLSALALCLGAGAPAQAADSYALAGGCYALAATETGGLVGEDGTAYRAGASTAEPFRLQATALGS